MNRGVLQLKSLVVRYCPHGGSSRGARDFVFGDLAAFAAANPAVDCASEFGRGKHPVVRGSYARGDDKVLDAKNLDEAAILGLAESLRNSTGRKMKAFTEPVITANPSIQGAASPARKLRVSIQPQTRTPVMEELDSALGGSAPRSE